MFLLAFLCFMIGGLSVSQRYDQYLSMFSFFIGYTFIVLIFAYPSKTRTDDKNQDVEDFFVLQQQLSETSATLQMTEEHYRDLFENINGFDKVIINKELHDKFNKGIQ